VGIRPGGAPTETRIEVLYLGGLPANRGTRKAVAQKAVYARPPTPELTQSKAPEGRTPFGLGVALARPPSADSAPPLDSGATLDSSRSWAIHPHTASRRLTRAVAEKSGLRGESRAEAPEDLNPGGGTRFGFWKPSGADFRQVQGLS